MIRPVSFGFNPQTAGSNAFQKADAEQQQVQDKALQEFDNFVSILRANGVNVIVIDDTAEPHTPDSIFPNNWVSFHSTGDILLYPMQAENRRLERREDIITQLEDQFAVRHVIDLSRYEQQHKFLEGTGSMVLDRENQLAYACLSPRTDKDVLDDFCRQTGYSPVLFHAFDQHGQAIYHTNVLMCMAERFVVICLDSITDPKERETVVASFYSTQKNIFDISFEQMNQFAGNMLEVFNAEGESLLVMSGSAYRSLSPQQVHTLQQFSRLVYADIPTIERNGGGSARCMMAEVRLVPLGQ
ncbi:amidinotransferase [Mucilaginibacter mali]|uniref:Amidinotransferase n=2 Tax=Mucilaginibacter mali TaxID=2740462 RepID=A0A7D4PXB5_9SPHI|nr:amidinotransferase [Mucilaginibacter mali]